MNGKTIRRSFHFTIRNCSCNGGLVISKLGETAVIFIDSSFVEHSVCSASLYPAELQQESQMSA